MDLNTQYLRLKQAENLLTEVQDTYFCEPDGCSECSRCDLEEIVDKLSDIIGDYERGIINISGEKKLKELQNAHRIR